MRKWTRRADWIRMKWWKGKMIEANTDEFDSVFDWELWRKSIAREIWSVYVPLIIWKLQENKIEGGRNGNKCEN
jgi:hypothetical protein